MSQPALRTVLAALAAASSALTAGHPLKAANTLPVASSASYTVRPGEAVSITLSATDADEDTLSYIVTTLPASGTLTAGPVTLSVGSLPYTIPDNGNTLTFTAASTDSGILSFQFKANDGSADSSPATVTILVNSPPAEIATTFFTEPNNDLDISLPVEDPDDDALTYTIESLPGHGRLESGSTTLGDDDIPFETTTSDVTYAPDLDYHGRDTFDITASDGTEATDPITVDIEVNTTPVPDAISATVPPDGSTTIQLTSTDADRDAVLYTIVSLPEHGTLDLGETGPNTALPVQLAAGQTTVVYTVDLGYRGTDSFHYRVQDDVSVSDRVAVTIAVNNPPVALGGSAAGEAGGTVQGTLAPTDADGDALVVRISGLPASGTLKIGAKAVSDTTTTYDLSGASVTYAYTPNSGFSGTDSFQWVANDGKEDSSPAEVVITIASSATSEDGTTDSTISDANPSGGAQSADDGTTPGDDSAGDAGDDEGEEVLSSDATSSDSIADPCGILGLIEFSAMTVVLLAVPRRLFGVEFCGTTAV